MLSKFRRLSSISEHCTVLPWQVESTDVRVQSLRLVRSTGVAGFPAEEQSLGSKKGSLGFGQFDGSGQCWLQPLLKKGCLGFRVGRRLAGLGRRLSALERKRARQRERERETEREREREREGERER